MESTQREIEYHLNEFVTEGTGPFAALANDVVRLQVPIHQWEVVELVIQAIESGSMRRPRDVYRRVRRQIEHLAAPPAELPADLESFFSACKLPGSEESPTGWRPEFVEYAESVAGHLAGGRVALDRVLSRAHRALVKRLARRLDGHRRIVPFVKWRLKRTVLDESRRVRERAVDPRMVSEFERGASSDRPTEDEALREPPPSMIRQAAALRAAEDYECRHRDCRSADVANAVLEAIASGRSSLEGGGLDSVMGIPEVARLFAADVRTAMGETAPTYYGSEAHTARERRRRKDQKVCVPLRIWTGGKPDPTSPLWAAVAVALVAWLPSEIRREVDRGRIVNETSLWSEWREVATFLGEDPEGLLTTRLAETWRA